MSGNSNGLQAKIRSLYPSAVFIHCFSHKLNLVLSQSCSKIRECKIFFSALSGMVRFFNHSSKRMFTFDKIVNRRMPSSSQTRWDFNGRIVLMLANHLEDLKTLFRTIIHENAEKWDSETINMSIGYLHLIEEDGLFLSQLYFFSDIFPEVDILFKNLQTKSNDISSALNNLKTFDLLLEDKKNNFEKFWEEINKIEDIEQKLKNSRSRNEASENPKSFLENLIIKIINIIKEELEFRFGNLQGIDFIQLLNISKFSQYATSFPSNLLQSLEKIYYDFFEIASLKTELSAVYRNKEFQEKKYY